MDTKTKRMHAAMVAFQRTPAGAVQREYFDALREWEADQTKIRDACRMAFPQPSTTDLKRALVWPTSFRTRLM